MRVPAGVWSPAPLRGSARLPPAPWRPSPPCTRLLRWRQWNPSARHGVQWVWDSAAAGAAPSAVAAAKLACPLLHHPHPAHHPRSPCQVADGGSLSLALGGGAAIAALGAALVITDPQKRRAEQMQATGGDELAAVKTYFDTAGFERWNKIYGETDEINKVRRGLQLPSCVARAGGDCAAWFATRALGQQAARGLRGGFRAVPKPEGRGVLPGWADAAGYCSAPQPATRACFPSAPGRLCMPPRCRHVSPSAASCCRPAGGAVHSRRACTGRRAAPAPPNCCALLSVLILPSFRCSWTSATGTRRRWTRCCAGWTRVSSSTCFFLSVLFSSKRCLSAHPASLHRGNTALASSAQFLGAAPPCGCANACTSCMKERMRAQAAARRCSVPPLLCSMAGSHSCFISLCKAPARRRLPCALPDPSLPTLPSRRRRRGGPHRLRRRLRHRQPVHPAGAAGGWGGWVEQGTLPRSGADGTLFSYTPPPCLLP